MRPVEQFLTAQEAAQIAGESLDCCHLDLLHAIERKEFPSGTVKVQIDVLLPPFGCHGVPVVVARAGPVLP